MMAIVEKWFAQDLNSPVQIQILSGNVFSQDNYGSIIGIRCYRNGEPAALQGSVSATVVRPDGATVAVVGTLSGNSASVSLPYAACAVPGVISVCIKVTNGATVATVGLVVATVYKTSTDTVLDPGTIIPSIETLIAQIETAVASIPADYSNLWETFTPAFDQTATYKAGQYVTYNGSLYIFTAEHSGSWNASDVKTVNIGDDLYKLDRVIDTPEIDVTYSLKGWQNGTGFITVDTSMGIGEVAKDDEYPVVVSTDFTKYVASVYYFTTKTNLYPQWVGNMSAPYTIPAGQYFTYFVRYKTGVSTLAEEDIENIPVVTSCKKAVGIWDEINRINGALASNDTDYTLVLKGWENGTGFINSDSVMSPGEVLINNDYDVIVGTDFTKFVTSVYYFASPSDLYPRWVGNMTDDYTIPKGQYYTFTVRYKAGASTLSQTDIDYIPTCTKAVESIGVWNAIEGLRTEQAEQLSTPDYKFPFVSVVADYPMGTQIQGGFISDGKLYQFSGAGEYPDDYLGRIYVVDLTEKTITPVAYHALGHSGCVSYVEEKDALIVGRVMGGTPFVQIYRNFVGSAVEGATLRPGDANCVNIQLDGEILRGKTGFDVVIGENNRTAYAACSRIASTNDVLMYKILLGTGDADFSGDENGYGTFASGTQEDEYNGTCKIVAEWYLPQINRQPQTIAYEKGGLWMLNGLNNAEVMRYKIVDGKYYADSVYQINDINKYGTPQTMEPESIAFAGDTCYIGMWDNTSPTKMRLLLVKM